MQQIAQTDDGQMVAYGKRVIAVTDSSSGTNDTHFVVQETVAVAANPVYAPTAPKVSYITDDSDDVESR